MSVVSPVVPGVGRAIKRLREGRGISQATLAQAIGVTQTAVGLWETERQNPTLARLYRVATELDVSVERITELASRIAGGDRDA